MITSNSFAESRLHLLLGIILSAGMLATNSNAQSAASTDVMEIEVTDFQRTRMLFSVGPLCSFIMASIHVYDLNEQRFMSGSELRQDFPIIADKVRSRIDSADECPASTPREELEMILGHKLPSSEQRVVFFFDLPGNPPFEHFSEKSRTYRASMYELFAQVGSNAKVHLRLAQAKF